MANGEVFLIQGDNIVLGNGSGVSIVATSQPTRVEARSVTLNGVISTGGHDLTIVADMVEFSSGSQIDTSGQPGFGYDSNVDLNAHIGKNGVAGANGKPGTDAANVIIYASQLKGILNVKAAGGQGSQGQPGGDGLKGDDGDQHPHVIFWEDCGFVSGATGSSGGQGGMGGKPGSSGAGGNVDVYLKPTFNKDGTPSNPLPKPPILNLNGGPSPGDAPSGHGGPGGGGGPVPPCGKVPPGMHPTVTHRLAHPGAQGDTGAQQVQPMRASAGKNGLFCGQDSAIVPLQPHLLPVKDLAVQVSPQTLWDVLQAGEQHYINERYELASLSLSFVSMMGRR